MKIILALIALTAAMNCLCQTQKDSASSNIIYFEDFTNNKNNWTVASNRNVNARMDSGFYYLTATGHAWGEAQEVKINTRKNFEIETRIKIVSGNAEHKNYYSMIFWGRDGMNSNYFTFAGDGFASVEFCTSKNQNDCITNSGSLKKSPLNSNDFNVYTVRKIGNTYTFFINGTQFHTMPFTPFYGNLIGFGAGRKVTLAIDYLKVFYL
jgi:hypothetical protein